jgi:diadenosine tetraphosphatase ApaH/serine/threonine PP2A family protein phosphatase
MIFSDVHGNLEALQAVLAHGLGQSVDRHICLGDLVGYGPQPEECVRVVQGLAKCRVVAGNHDLASLWETSPYGMSPTAQKVILWTMEQLSPQSKEYFANLPDRLDISGMTFAHANPYNPRGWGYVFDRKHALRCFAATPSQFLFIGHSHRPLVITRNNGFSLDIQPVPGTIRYKVNSGRRRIFNCGSVGQPRDKDNRACYIIVDTQSEHVEFFRVPYAVEKTARAAKHAGLPDLLGNRLKKGM